MAARGTPTESDLRALLEEAKHAMDRIQCDGERILRSAAELPSLNLRENLATSIKANAESAIDQSRAFLAACRKEGL